MFKILFGFVIIGLINCSIIREDNNYENSEEQDKTLEELESKYNDYMASDESNSMDSDSYGQSSHSSSPVSAAIKTKRYNRVIPVQSTHEETSPRVIEINPYRQPFHFVFKTESNPLSVQQIHTALPGKTEKSQSEDEPHRVMHKVFRPVIQEIKEVIQPYRRIRQEIKPVLEEVLTVVSQNEGSSRGEGRGSRKRGESYSTRAESASQKQSQSGKRMRSLELSSYDMDLAKDYSNRKGLYKFEDSTDQKPRELKRERQYSPEVYYNQKARYQSESELQPQPQLQSQTASTESQSQKPREVKKERQYASEDYSNRKSRSQSENDSTEQLLREIQKEKQFIPEIKSIVEQMNSILAGDRLRPKTPEVQHQTLASNHHRQVLTPILSLNAGKVKILGWSDGPIYSE